MTGSARPLDLVIDDLTWGVETGVGARTLLDGVTLDVPAGIFVGVVGPNGAGKSSLLRCIYRYNRPWSGRITVGGDDVWYLTARESARRVAVVLQDGGDAVALTCAEVVALGRLPHQGLFGGRRSVDEAIVEEALERVGLTTECHRPFNTLSGGERQRILLARAIAQQPSVLVLDEPTNHLDPRYQMEMLRLVRGLGVTVVAALHDLNQAAAFCDRMVMMRGGRIVADGPPADVLTADALGDLYGLEALVDRHPRTGRSRVTFHG